MDELDSIDPLTHNDRTGLLTRATDWRTRIATLPDLTLVPVSRGTDSARLHLTLPPECVQLGELALALTPLDWPLRPTLIPSPVTWGQRPQAWLQWDLDEHQPAVGGDAVELTHLCQGELHPTQVFLDLYSLLHHLNAQIAQLPAADNLAALDDLRPACPTTENPAKRLAHLLHERIPLVWGSDATSAIARDWAMRQLWYAERQAWSATTAEVAMLQVMARLPRYLPNTITWVQLALTAAHDPLAAGLRQIATRRRLPLHTVALPAGLDQLEAAIYLLEFGEWVALYGAALNDIDPGERVPHQILF